MNKIIFTKQLGKVDDYSPDSIKKIADHIRIIQEQLEYRLSYLDSSNISEINASDTDIFVDGKKINNVLSDTNGNISKIKQDTESIVLQLSQQDKNITTLSATIDGISTKVTDLDGSVSSLSQTSSSISTRVTNLEGNISTITQNANAISAKVSSLESGMSTTVRISENGVLISNETDESVTISGGQIDAKNLNLSGNITFSNFVSSTGTAIAAANNNALAANNNALAATNTALQIAYGNFVAENGAFISERKIYSPELYGDTITLLDGNSYPVGTISLKYSETYAFDITSNYSIRLQAADGYNAYLGVSGGSSVMCVRDNYGQYRVQLGGGHLVIPQVSFGNTLPTGRYSGQVFFLY